MFHIFLSKIRVSPFVTTIGLQVNLYSCYCLERLAGIFKLVSFIFNMVFVIEQVIYSITKSTFNTHCH